MKKFISFEGGEGVGKTTQSNLLFKSLKSIKEKCIITVNQEVQRIRNN